MSDEHQTPTSATTTESLSLSHHDIPTESLIFQGNTMVSPLSSASPMLPQDLISMQGLDSSEAATSFSVSDIVASSGSAMINADQVISAETEGLGVAEYQIVDSGNGEFIVVTSTLPHKVAGLSEVNTSVADQTQTITLNQEEAIQLLLQQQGLSRAVQLHDGSLQILGQSLMDKEGLSLEVLQTLQGDFVQTIPNMESPYCLTEAAPVIEEKPETEGLKEDPIITKETEQEMADVHSRIISKETEKEADVRNVIIPVTMQETSLIDPKKEFGDAMSDTEQQQDVGDNDENPINEEMEDFDEMHIRPHESKDISDQTKAEETKAALGKVPDLNSPIPVTDQTVVMIKGKKCILAFNEETQQMCAYPIKHPAGTKRRGRPKMTEEEKQALAEKRKQEREKGASGETEQSSAAETLLELSSVGADGVRRSARKRKKAKLLEEYEELDDSDDEQPFVDNQDKDPDITLSLPDLKKRKIAIKEESFTSSPAVFATPVIKRARGRPRRYPPPGQSHIPTSIPAVIIPSPNGQTLVMTELQGFPNLHNFQRQLPNLVPKPPPPTVETSQVTATEGTDISTLSLGGESDPLHLDTSEALDNQNIIPSALQGDTVPIVGGDSDHLETTDGADSTDKPKEDTLSLSQEGDQLSQPTVIQIPENLLPMLGIKKDPIKIGLKASERDLEKLKCPKCDFQGFYAHQYRAHIATHGDDIHKCKCCSYVSLDGDELLAHFKEFHPRCICPECDFMAEHAYIIKRHMMRHNAKSCTCHICGKVYKDMYILKMHVKMVHMPAEVLFECNVCCKKFTRKAHLKRHLRIHEPEKPFKCPHCEYRGCERSDISKHMLIHEEPKHVCERCGKTFRHIKNKELHVKRHYGQRDYKCGVCDFFGYTFTDIRKHIERKHQDMKTLICDKCNKHFRSELALKDHQQVCNVMMIEQILSIPNSAGGTSQATIQIPTVLGPDGQRIVLDGQAMATTDGQSTTAIPLGSQAISVDGKTISINKQDGVSIVVTEQQLGLTSVADCEEGLLELEHEGAMNQTMQIIGETIMTESGEQLRIVSQESLNEAVQDAHGHVVSISGHAIETHHNEDVQESSLAVILPDTENGDVSISDRNVDDVEQYGEVATVQLSEKVELKEEVYLQDADEEGEESQSQTLDGDSHTIIMKSDLQQLKSEQDKIENATNATEMQQPCS